MGAETTFERDLVEWDEAVAAIGPLVAKVAAACAGGGHSGRTVTAKLKYADFRQITRSKSVPDPVATEAEVQPVARELLRPLFPPPCGIRLLGVTLSSLGEREQPASGQMSLVWP